MKSLKPEDLPFNTPVRVKFGTTPWTTGVVVPPVWPGSGAYPHAMGTWVKMDSDSTLHFIHCARLERRDD